MSQNKRKTVKTPMSSGFTLVELAIVLLIIAVITGGVLAGQNLIQTANLNSFVSKMQEFKSAFSRYQIKYNALPGDDTKAYDRWSRSSASNSSNCEGDGDVDVEDDETYKAWKHLELSEMIDDKLCDPDVTANCYVSGASDDCEPSINIPSLPFESLAATFAYDDDDAKSSNITTPGQLMKFGALGNSVVECATTGYFTVEQLFILDKKMDDGLAYNGKILNSEDTTGCSTSSGTADNGEYDLANNGVSLCILFYRLKVD